MSAQPKLLSRRTKWAISVLVLGHLMAVVLPPLSFQTRGPLGVSPSVASVLGWFEPYSQLLYIDRGYAFFAPDPGPSHLVQAAITDSQGQLKEVMFPDRSEQWPRLLYHRHFMLTEFLEEIYEPPGPPSELIEIDPVQAEYWKSRRTRYEYVRQSYVDHLRAVHPNSEVAIRRIEHRIPEILEFQNRPIELTDESLYRVMLDQPIEWQGPRLPAESIPAPAVMEDAGLNFNRGNANATLPPALNRNQPAERIPSDRASTPASGERP